MHSRIIEVRNGRPFSAEEVENGVMNSYDILRRYEDEYFDYIVPSESHREEDISWFCSRLNEVFLRKNDESIIFFQNGYDKYVETYVSRLKEMSDNITPRNFYPEKAHELVDLLSSRHNFDFFVYNEDDNDIMPVREWLLSTGHYHDVANERIFYIGKIWDYHV